MIVRDEAATLSRCLNSIADLAGELIIVDTGSTDTTLDIAHQHHATVLHHDFTHVDFAAARNAGLAAATGEFVLVLDADETLNPASAATVRAISGNEIGYVVQRRNIPADPAKPQWFDHAVRLFTRNPLFRYAGRVHETIDASILGAGGRLVQSTIVLDHHLAPESELRAKGRRYLDLMRSESSDDPDRLVFVAAEYHKLEMYAEATAVAERVAALSPHDFDANFTAALYHFFYAGDPVRAAEDLATAMRIHPDAPEARELLTALEAR
jgi:glycosyltransferase involved in cell wall biosynthesis